MSKVCAIWHHTETWVLSLGRPEFRRKFNLESKKMLFILANCRKYVDSACSLKKLQFDRKIFRSRVRRALTAASRYHPPIRFEAANCRWKWQNYFGNLEWQFVSKVDVQETPYKCKPKFAPRLIIQICARSALSLITWLVDFFWRGKGKAKLMEDGAQEKLYEYINSNSLQSLITQICARSKSSLIFLKLLILWNFLKIGVAIFLEDATHRLSDILPMAFRTYRPRPFAHTPARNICGRSKLWCWRHRCTVRGSTSGAVYTS